MSKEVFGEEKQEPQWIKSRGRSWGQRGRGDRQANQKWNQERVLGSGSDQGPTASDPHRGPRRDRGTGNFVSQVFGVFSHDLI